MDGTEESNSHLLARDLAVGRRSLLGAVGGVLDGSLLTSSARAADPDDSNGNYQVPGFVHIRTPSVA